MSANPIQPAEATPWLTPSAAAASKYLPTFQSLGADDFARLLSARLAAPGGEDEPDPLSSLSPFSTGSPGLPTSNPFTLLNQTLMLQLLTRMEELLAEPETSDPSETSDVAALAPGGMPVAGPISQHFHDGHQAVDIAVPVGTPVRSTGGGQVVYAGWNSEGYGNLVIVQNGAQRTYYAHLDRIPVALNQSVQAGEVIGYSGNTGNSTGPHLHYEVRVNGIKMRPDFDEHDHG